MMNPVIGPYEPEFKNACIEAFKSNVPLYFTKDEVYDFTTFLDEYVKQGNEKSTHYFVLRVNNHVVGCAGWGDKDHNGKITLAWGLIHQSYHQKGYGSLLLKHRLNHINATYPYATVYLDTTQHSYEFFHRFGFEITGITKDFYALDLHRYDMKIKLSEERSRFSK